MARVEHPLTAWLRRSPAWVFTLVASLAGFSTYFSMYAFRKPFAAGAFEGTFPLFYTTPGAVLSWMSGAFGGTLPLFHTTIKLKAALVISQTLGYACSKFLGIKVCSEATPSRRAVTLVGLVLVAEAALVLFGLVGPNWKVLAIFLNGVPLGMIWGLVVWYLEGRRTTEILLAALSCSQIVSSGVVRAAGLWLMDFRVTEGWMPAATGLCFLPLLFASVWLLTCLPHASAADVAARAPRQPMSGKDRIAFLWRFFTGMALLCLFFFFLTAYRDYRDVYEVDVLRLLGYGDSPAGLLSQMESLVGVALAIAMGALYLVRDNRRALLSAFVVMFAGMVLLGGGTLLFDRRQISGATWMVLIGLGVYLAYVPYQTLLFERLMAATRCAGTAVFAIALSDAVGYTGSVAVQLYKEFGGTAMNRLEFLRAYTYFMSLVGAVSLAAAYCYFFLRVPRRATDDTAEAVTLTETTC